jgi:tRNA threonylcarbamoyladenosine biosynthesis protein TsaB
MKVLAVDTSTPTCSVAIVEQTHLICELVLGTGQTHSANLLSLVTSALKAARMDITQIDGFGVTVGPGSFTGLRIGLGVVKGLALALDRRVVGVSSLEALAHPCRAWPGLICALLDARKGEVYYAHYGVRADGGGARGADEVGPVEQALAGIVEPCLFVGGGARFYRERIVAAIGERARFAEGGLDLIRASTVAELACVGFGRNQALDAGRLVPRYVRRSEAGSADRLGPALAPPAGAENRAMIDKFQTNC